MRTDNVHCSVGLRSLDRERRASGQLGRSESSSLVGEREFSRMVRKCESTTNADRFCLGIPTISLLYFQLHRYVGAPEKPFVSYFLSSFSAHVNETAYLSGRHSCMTFARRSISKGCSFNRNAKSHFTATLQRRT